MAQKREREETELKITENLPSPISICTPPPPQASISSPPPSIEKLSEKRTSTAACSTENPDLARRGSKRPREVNRCSGSGCRKKIGLTGFRCRCGDLFCGEHRYSDRHDCTYDYKAAGRAAIARENPVVRAAKLVKV